MKTRVFYILITMILLELCSGTIEAKFEINNDSDYRIVSINIKSADHGNTSNYVTIEIGETNNYLFDMTDIPQVDGDYLLTYKNHESKQLQKRFGYFTNGYPQEKLTKISIQNNTVIIDQIFRVY